MDSIVTACPLARSTKSNLSVGHTSKIKCYVFNNDAHISNASEKFRFIENTFVAHRTKPEILQNRRITRISMPSLPTQRYRRQAVRNNLDIVGESWVYSRIAPFQLHCLCLFQYRLGESWVYSWAPASWVFSNLSTFLRFECPKIWFKCGFKLTSQHYYDCSVCIHM